MTRPDPADYGTDGNRHALDAREHDERDAPPQTHPARSPLHAGGRTVKDNDLCKRLGSDHKNHWTRLNVHTLRRDREERRINPLIAIAIGGLLFITLAPLIALSAPKMAKGAIHMIEYATTPGCTRNVCHMPLEE